VTLTPENTKVEFVGIHLPPKQPDPRTGGFEKLSGKAKVDASGKALQAVSVEIDTTSLWTEVGGRLTDHLKSADFLEIREYPTIKFESTKIEPGQGQAQITGQLTMHGVTKVITFPATVEVNEGGLTLRSEFSLDRTEYGVNYQPNAVGKEVKITAVIGEKTQPRQGGGGGRGRGKGKRGVGGQQEGETK
jgi:polyisoprenoid-binding protein YceI